MALAILLSIADAPAYALQLPGETQKVDLLETGRLYQAGDERFPDADQVLAEIEAG